MTKDDREIYKHAAEHYREINGGISDPDTLMNVPNGQWKDSMSDQIISQTGYDIRCDPSDEEMQRSMDRLLRLIQTRRLFPDNMMRFVNALDGYWGRASSELRNTIEDVFGNMILHLIEQSVSDQSLMSAMRRSNPEMLERILKKTPKKWFGPHKISEECDGKTVRKSVPGLYRANDPELFDFIGDKRGVKWNTIQTVMAEDVMEPWNKENGRAKSHKGLVTNIVCNQMEQYVPGHFAYTLRKIEIDNRKGHKTPDWLILNELGEAIGTAECYAGSKDSVKDGVHKAIEHGDSKESGADHYAGRLGLTEDRIRISTYVRESPTLGPFMDENWFAEVVAGLRKETKMDGLLYVRVAECIQRTEAIYFDISGRDVRSLLGDDVEYFRVPAIIQTSENEETDAIPVVLRRRGTRHRTV